MSQIPKKVWRAFLWLVEVLISFRLHRPLTPLTEEPFQRATAVEWRRGLLFVASFPLGILLMILGPVGRWLEFASPAMLWVSFVILVLLGGYGLLLIGPRVPVFASIVIGVLTWPFTIWYALSRTH
jgi:hypothetical protein